MGVTRNINCSSKFKINSICPYFYLFVLVLLLYSIETISRNNVWKDNISLWQDVVQKSRHKVRGNYNIGVAYDDDGQMDKAVLKYKAVLNIKPLKSDSNYLLAAINNLGNIYHNQGRLEEALREYNAALAIKADYPPAYYNIGNLYSQKGAVEDAIF